MASRLARERTAFLRLFVAACLALGLTSCAGWNRSADDGGTDGFASIFDGKTLRGWEAYPPSSVSAWSVEDGVLVGDGDKGVGYLIYEKRDIADLELKFDYRFPGKGNSGVSLRAVPDGTGTRSFQSYHADLGHVGIGENVLGAWDFHTPGRKEHGCARGYRTVVDENDEARATPLEGAISLADIKDGGWNSVHVIARDNRFQLFINGKPSAEFVEYLPRARRLARGMIQLQVHDPGMVVLFRNVRLKILD